MLHGWRRRAFRLLGVGGGEHHVHRPGELHQGLDVGRLPVELAAHVREQIVHPGAHAVVWQVEVDQNVADMDAQAAEAAVGEVSVQKLQQEAELLLLTTRKSPDQGLSSDKLHQQTVRVFWLLSRDKWLQHHIEGFAVLKLS